MVIICPKCLSKSRIAIVEVIEQTTNRVHCQCKNLNCSSTFTALVEVMHETGQMLTNNKRTTVIE